MTVQKTTWWVDTKRIVHNTRIAREETPTPFPHFAAKVIASRTSQTPLHAPHNILCMRKIVKDESVLDCRIGAIGTCDVFAQA